VLATPRVLPVVLPLWVMWRLSWAACRAFTGMSCRYLPTVETGGVLTEVKFAVKKAILFRIYHYAPSAVLCGRTRHGEA
jgi:hypothetical protein